MPANARIFLAEDFPAVREAVRQLLANSGHTVILEAGTLQEALEKTKQAQKNEVNVGLIDGSLSGGPSDGPKIAEALRKAVPGVKIVSFSGDSDVDWGDINPGKNNIAKIGDIITNLH